MTEGNESGQAYNGLFKCCSVRGFAPSQSRTPAGWLCSGGWWPSSRRNRGIERRWTDNNGGKRLTELAKNIITSVRKRVISAGCDCSLIRHRRLLLFRQRVERRQTKAEDDRLLEKRRGDGNDSGDLGL